VRHVQIKFMKAGMWEVMEVGTSFMLKLPW